MNTIRATLFPRRGVQDFRKLQVWAKAHALTLQIYAVTQAFPRQEAFGLAAQLRRGAASVGANLAEGCGRDGPREMCRFVQIALASAKELEYHLLLVRDLGLVPEATHQELDSQLDQIKRMLGGLLRRLRRAPAPARRSRPESPGTRST